MFAFFDSAWMDTSWPSAAARSAPTVACSLLMWANGSQSVPGWQTCPDGSAAPGEQTFTFWARRLDAPDRHDRMTGFDQTLGPSGACGVNRPFNVRMPFTLTRAG